MHRCGSFWQKQESCLIRAALRSSTEILTESEVRHSCEKIAKFFKLVILVRRLNRKSHFTTHLQWDATFKSFVCFARTLASTGAGWRIYLSGANCQDRCKILITFLRRCVISNVALSCDGWDSKKWFFDATILFFATCVLATLGQAIRAVEITIASIAIAQEPMSFRQNYRRHARNDAVLSNLRAVGLFSVVSALVAASTRPVSANVFFVSKQ